MIAVAPTIPGRRPTANWPADFYGQPIGAPPVKIEGDMLTVRWADFSTAGYDLFLRCKCLPEFEVLLDDDGLAAGVRAPARFAPMLGVSLPPRDAGDLTFSPFLYDDQLAITRMALDAKRFAVWADCGLGKTLVELEWALHVAHRTGGRVLIVTFAEIVPQFIDEAHKFHPNLDLTRLRSREAMKQWCAGPRDGGIAITNYEKFNHQDESDQVVSELRMLAGLVLDESSRLKTGGGKQKWAIIKSARGIEYKLSATATPAPNETAEFASQASFLEKMRDDRDIIWTYFTRDQKTHRWTVKKHARESFFRFMAGWSIYVRDPRRYGWRKDVPDVPPPIIIEHKIAPTPEQRDFIHAFHADANGQLSLCQTRDTNAIERNRQSQVAKGFLYQKTATGRHVQHIASNKPRFVADLIADEAAVGTGLGLQTLVWTTYDAEADILDKLLIGAPFAVETLTGRTPRKQRLEILDRFRTGETRALISRASMLGWGMNFQFCGSTIFSGFTDSYEQFYQAIRRFYRWLQTMRVRVHIPFIPELEGDMWHNILHKQSQHEASIAEAEAQYIVARKALEAA